MMPEATCDTFAPNLATDFFARAAAQPDHPALLGPGDTDRIDYATLAQQVRDLARALTDAGLRPGMNIGLHVPNGPAYIAYTYAIWARGACVTPIPMELAAPEKDRIFEHIAIDAAVTAVRRGADLVAIAGADARELPLQALYLPDTARRSPPPELADLDPAFIRFTSGTTGAAKGVVLSHRTIRERIQAANAVLHIGPAERVVWLLSMAYHFAVSIVAYLSFGASIVLPANAFGAGILQAVGRHHATLIYGAPTHYELLTHDRSGANLATLRLAIVTTARLSAELADTFHDRYGRALNETYGIIEIGLPAINLDDPRSHQGSVGRVLPAYELKLAGAAADSPGEVLLRGPGLLDAYYDPWRPRYTILAEHDGWLATGDLGELGADGRLTLVGRRKELISVGGMKVFPLEVERVLEAHPAVREACVYAGPDRRLGEVPIADLVLDTAAAVPAATDLEHHCIAALAPYKVPRRFCFVARLPRTASGKLLRRAGRDDTVTTETGAAQRPVPHHLEPFATGRS